jgi:acyl-CoA thioesterase FadM
MFSLFAESYCTYKSSAKWPEILRVCTRIGHIGRRSLRFEFEIWGQDKRRLIANGFIAAVTINRDNFKFCPVPTKLREAAEVFEGELSASHSG